MHDKLRATVWILGFAKQPVRQSQPQSGRRVDKRRANVPSGCARLEVFAVVSAHSALTCDSLSSGSHQRGAAKVGLLGEGRLIAGIDKGLQDMCVNERRTVTVPPHLAYGSTGAGKQVHTLSYQYHNIIPIQADLLHLHAFADLRQPEIDLLLEYFS